MSTMNSEVYDALIGAGATETKAREAANSIAFEPCTHPIPRGVKENHVCAF